MTPGKLDLPTVIRHTEKNYFTVWTLPSIFSHKVIKLVEDCRGELEVVYVTKKGETNV
jgi:hypothetical protein